MQTLSLFLLVLGVQVAGVFGTLSALAALSAHQMQLSQSVQTLAHTSPVLCAD